VRPLDERSVFSRNLVRLRKSKHLTQEALAHRTGFTRFLIAFYETKASDPPASALIALSQALGVTIEELVLEQSEDKAKEQPILVDSRTFRKLAPVAALPRQQRLYVYKMIDSLVQSNEKAKSDVVAETPEPYRTDDPMDE